MDDAAVDAAAAFAADEISGVEDTVYAVVCAQEQVVAGTNYRFGLDLDGVTWLAAVYEDLDGVDDLSSSEIVE